MQKDKFRLSPLYTHIYGYSQPLSHHSVFVAPPSGAPFGQVNTTSADNSKWRVQTLVISSWWCDFPFLWYESFMASLERLAPPWGAIRERLGTSHISFPNDALQKEAGPETVLSVREVVIDGPNRQTVCWMLCHLIGCYIGFLLECPPLLQARWSYRILALPCFTPYQKHLFFTSLKNNDWLGS